MIPGIVSSFANTTAGVIYVGSGGEVYSVGTSISADPPDSLQVDDLILMVVMHRSALVMPGGWDLVNSEDCVGAGVSQSTSIYSRIATEQDIGSPILFSQSLSVRFGVQVVAFRGPLGETPIVVDTSSVSEDEKPDPSNIYTIAPITGSSSGQIAFSGISYVLSTTGGEVSLTPPEGWSLAMPQSFIERRLATSYSFLSNGQTASGAIASSVDGASPNGIASVSVLIGIP